MKGNAFPSLQSHVIPGLTGNLHSPSATPSPRGGPLKPQKARAVPFALVRIGIAEPQGFL